MKYVFSGAFFKTGNIYLAYARGKYPNLLLIIYLFGIKLFSCNHA